ncbi:glycoside hydrolase family 3 N-terminal domain-containing protein [Alkalimonas collagenimarina]|uniref:beta-N-acetylhexosaminidase n=2 Tax=Alkalimonas collagenimarina TaxID=400390 RepID=A0ABT9GZ53_9GAMM|nr:glycoside hydrolase family 3 N-terminal domain-containing protein [Alkalimonas collagenimarina]MDP4536322.1 glycoside hydrolase family 3 N-terminal domain-containing protein [Alkalimonas collagenimarina]
MALTACSKPYTEAQLREDIAQKLMIDIRYFCNDGTAAKSCRASVTSLPQEISDLISEYSVGGVILFQENLQSIEQIIRLNHQLQLAAKQSNSKQPLFIGIDQEGGRVFRTPRDQTTAFTGNMAIGATYKNYGSHFAEQSGAIIGAELKALGINLNFAPTVDVNNNPENPVINVRSYGEDPHVVAKLGLAQLTGMQQQGTLATLKHFPGHGDTHVDSHLGLPKVSHDRARIDAVELLPFRHSIEHGAPAMIMTAHIQYPALDDSQIIDINGHSQYRPATLSRAILTDLLRNEMGFQGIIITDALDMAGISHFFSPKQALIETFKAGADIALMPIRLHHPDDLNGLEELIEAVVNAVKRGELSETEIRQSADRIRHYKQHYQLADRILDETSQSINKARTSLGTKQHKMVEQQLAEAAITLVRGDNVPLDDTIKSLLLVMPERSGCMALQNELSYAQPLLTTECISMDDYQAEAFSVRLKAADAVLLGSITPAASLVEFGGMYDRNQTTGARLTPQQQQQLLPQLISQSKASDKLVYFVSLRTPYDINLLANGADTVLAVYGYNTHLEHRGSNQVVTGPAFAALARILTGLAQPEGELPVNLH